MGSAFICLFIVYNRCICMNICNTNFVLVTIITVFNVMQEVIDFLIFVYFSHLHLHLPCIYVTIHIIYSCSWYPGVEAIIMCSLYILMVFFVLPMSWKHLLGQTTCMMAEYTYKWLPTSLHCIPPLNMSMAHSQYLSRNSGIVNTCISEFGLVNKGVNNKFSHLFVSVNNIVHMQGTPMNKNISVRQASGGGGVHGEHIQPRHYSSEGEEKIIYTFCTMVWQPS